MDRPPLEPTVAPSDLAAGQPDAREPADAQRPPEGVDGRTDPEGSLADGWGGLIERIRSSAAQIHEEKDRLQEREEKLQALALRMRDELRAANERALRAEARIREVEAELKREILDWKKRAHAAEEKVRSMEEWRSRTRDVILKEFG